MTQVIGSYQVSAFTTPVNGTPNDADQVRGNDNTLQAALNSHDGDSGIHFQSSDLADRPAAGTAGRKWLTLDTGRVYYDDGSNWQEIAYAHTSGDVTFFDDVKIIGALRASSLTNEVEGAANVFLINSNPAGVVGFQSAGAIQFVIGYPTGVVHWEIGVTGKLLGTGSQQILDNFPKTGWTSDPTGPLARTTFASDSVTLPNLAARVAALIVDLRSHGLIKA